MLVSVESMRQRLVSESWMAIHNLTIVSMATVNRRNDDKFSRGSYLIGILNKQTVSNSKINLVHIFVE